MTGSPASERLALARQVSDDLRRRQGKNIRAIGVMGSVARGTAQKYSDVDILVLVRRNPRSIERYQIRDNIYCSLSPETWKSAVEPITNPHEPHDLVPEILGGFVEIKPVFDPERLLARLEKVARSVPERVFKKSAELALVHSYEDFCRAKNAVMLGDEIVLMMSVQWTLHAAANIVAALNLEHFESDREILKAHRRWKRLPRGFNGIQRLAYGNLKGMKLFKRFLSFYVDLVRFSRQQGIFFPVEESILKTL